MEGRYVEFVIKYWKLWLYEVMELLLGYVSIYNVCMKTNWVHY